MADLVITPASSNINFYYSGSATNLIGTINMSSSNVLTLTATGGVQYGNSTSNVTVGDGSSSIDIIFPQSGAIRGLTGKTLTIGQSDSYVNLTGVYVGVTGNLLLGKTSVSATSGNGIQLISGGSYPEINIVNAETTYIRNSFLSYSSGASAYRFYVDMAGTIHATSTSIAAISDASLKTNIKPLETGLKEIMLLQPRRFDWLNGDGTNVAGFIAQEVEVVLPDLVGDYMYDHNVTKKQLKMGDMLPTLVKAVQELSAKNDALEARIAALESK
jgi:hypothetical protein